MFPFVSTAGLASSGGGPQAFLNPQSAIRNPKSRNWLCFARSASGWNGGILEYRGSRHPPRPTPPRCPASDNWVCFAHLVPRERRSPDRHSDRNWVCLARSTGLGCPAWRKLGLLPERHRATRRCRTFAPWVASSRPPALAMVFPARLPQIGFVWRNTPQRRLGWWLTRPAPLGGRWGKLALFCRSLLHVQCAITPFL